MKITQEQIDNWFTFHSPSADQLEKYNAIRVNAGTLASIIVEACPESADVSAAIRKLREVVMTANAAIACGGK